MRHLETAKGEGSVVANDGDRATVQYEIRIYQDEKAARHLLGDPHATIPGTTQLEGWITPACFFGQDGLRLEMEDGRKMQFFFTDTDGRIAFQSWVE